MSIRVDENNALHRVYRRRGWAFPYTHGGEIRSNKGPLVKIPRHGGRYEGVFWAGSG